MGTGFPAAKIAKAFASLDIMEYGEVLQCMRCGFCLPTCPTYRTDGVETQSPRGRVAMIKAVIDGAMPALAEFAEHMYHCLDCRHCHTVCPAGVKPGELVLEARHRIEEHRPQPAAKRFLLGYAISDQQRLSRLLAPLRWYQCSGLQALARKYGLLKIISSRLEQLETLLPALPPRPLTDTIDEEIPAQGREKGRVGFFLGCAMNLLYPEASRATAEVLSLAGYTVVIPKTQKCCGAPNIEEGERRLYREMAEYNIDLFAKQRVDAVVTDCAACGNELKSYRRIFAHQLPVAEKAQKFSASARDVSEFLAEVLPPGRRFGRVSQTVCFHDPCHLCHAQGIKAAPRELLNRIPGLTLTEVADESQCCGSAGVYSVTHPERSLKILKAKVEAINKTGAATVATSNPGCLLQLAYGKRRWQEKWEVKHISEILRLSLRRGQKGGGNEEAEGNQAVA